AVAEQLPFWALVMNLRRSKSFIVAVVPFDQIAIDFGGGREASQFTSASDALQWTSEDLRESQSGQPRSKVTCVALASLGQRQVSKTSVLAATAPGGLGVSRVVQPGKHCS